jgi:plasmid replication initiation protein
VKGIFTYRSDIIIYVAIANYDTIPYAFLKQKRQFDSMEKLDTKEIEQVKSVAENEASQPNGRLTDYNVSMSNQLVRSAHSLTLVEKRCIGAVIAQVDSRKGSLLHAHLSAFKKIRLTALEYAETYGVDNKNSYNHLKQAANHLFDRQFSVVSRTEGGNKRLTKYRWVSSISYVQDEGYVELSFSEDIYKHLHALSRDYTSYKLKNAASFRSVYTWRLFEYAKSWLGHCSDPKTKKPSTRITVENLRRILDVPASYLWNDVKKRAIDPAIKEIQKYTEMEITYEILKKGRSTHALDILVKEKEQMEFKL